MRKMHVKILVDCFIEADDNVEVADIMEQLEISTDKKGARVVDIDIMDYSVTDSR